MHLMKPAIIPKVARARVRTMMTQVAPNLAALMPRIAHQIARLVAQREHLGRVEALAVVEAAVAVLAAVGQVVLVAQVQAAHLAAVLERLDRVGVRLGQLHVDALVVPVELVEGPRGGRRTLRAGDVDGHGRGAAADRRVAVGHGFGSGGGRGGRSCGGCPGRHDGRGARKPV